MVDDILNDDPPLTPTGRTATGDDAMTDDTPLTLAEASSLLRGLVSAATLRRAADRGELTAYRLGRRIVTTPAAVREYCERCRLDQSRPGSGSGQRPGIDQPRGSSSTEVASTARAAALTIFREPAPRSNATSERRASSARPADVIRPTFPSRMS